MFGMACCKSLLILPYICVLCPFVSLNVTNETSNNVRLNNIHTSNTRDLNISVKLPNETLSQSYSGPSLVKEEGRRNPIFTNRASYREDLGVILRVCDCGENSISCSLDEDGKKECTCKDGYVPQISLPNFEVKCEACDCGKGAISCELNILKHKKCTCKKGYATYKKMYIYDDEACKECDCGIDEIYCEINQFGRRKCTCGGNSVMDSSGSFETCKKCSCGPNSISCQMMFGSKVCNCNPGYVVKRASWSSDEECALQECSCGPNSNSCKRAFGRKVCSCNAGYVVKRASWSSDDECALPYKGKLPSPMSVWKTLTYIVTAVYVFIILTFLAVIFRKRTNRRV